MNKKSNPVWVITLVRGVVAIGILIICQDLKAKMHYEPTWESLKTHSVPGWYVDAKFGLYAHWGVYSVPAYGSEWYGKLMYDKNNKSRGYVYGHHKEQYGDPSEFGYKDFVPLFKAEKFDPKGWAKLAKESGAQYAGICVVHHDGFAMWDSDVNPWNVGNMGPKRDIYGELVKAFREEGLRVVATLHHSRTFNWFISKGITEKEKETWDLFYPEYSDFYWNKYTSTEEEFREVLKAKYLEVIDNYMPDLLWFDGGPFNQPEYNEIIRYILAHYYNKAQEWGKEVDVFNKLPTSLNYNFLYEVGILDFENDRDRPDGIIPRIWVSDVNIGRPWGYVKDMEYRSANELVDGLVDRVSVNGGILLSLSPKANGEIPEEQKNILLEIGRWLKINGEAIYGTHPWIIYGEGPAKMMEFSGEHMRWDYSNMTAKDIRFTRKGNVLYAIALDWPKEGKILIKSLNSLRRLSAEEGIYSITLLGSEEELKWTRDYECLTIELPDEKPCKYAFSFKINLKGKIITID